jgi:AraC-like DNA-binding protein
MGFANYRLIDSFPNAKTLEWKSHNRQFVENNVIIHALAKDIYYPAHWGPLSVKTVGQGKEFYKLNNCTYVVDEKRYLIVNHGTDYSSYIESEAAVESFTINFSPDFVNETVYSSISKDNTLLDNICLHVSEFNFYEKLYLHDESISPLITSLRMLSKNFENNISRIEELYHFLLVKLLYQQTDIEKDVANIMAVKCTTRKELYKRLHRVKDYIDSCYHEDVSLDELAKIGLLNPSYLLRQFKNHFKITPRQYVIRRRMEEARRYLESGQKLSVTEICLKVGYDDLVSFTKLFKCFYKQPPDRYRVLHRARTCKVSTRDKSIKRHMHK